MKLHITDAQNYGSRPMYIHRYIYSVVDQMFRWAEYKTDLCEQWPSWRWMFVYFSSFWHLRFVKVIRCLNTVQDRFYFTTQSFSFIFGGRNLSYVFDLGDHDKYWALLLISQRLIECVDLMQRVQKRLAILNKRTKGGCSCMCLLLSVVAIVILVIVAWLLIKYL